MLGKLLIRADASVAMGTGHVMRCLALVQSWQDAGGPAVYAAAELTETIRARVLSEGCEIAAVAGTPGGVEDATHTVAIAREQDAAWVAVDGYHFDGAYEQAIKSAGLKLLWLADDGLDRLCQADFILNQNFDASESMYPQRAPHTRLLLGLRFVLLRREFRAWSTLRRAASPEVRKILVSMGGSDPDNVTGLVIDALRMVKISDWQATVVAGGSNPHFEELQRQSAAADGLKIRLERSVFNMPELISNADLAIIAAGGTLWEMLYLACPVLSFGRDPLQRRILDALQSHGIVRHLGDPRAMEPAGVAEAMDELSSSHSERARMATLGREQVDGEGAKRVADLLAGSI